MIACKQRSDQPEPNNLETAQIGTTNYRNNFECDNKCLGGSWRVALSERNNFDFRYSD